ncbi:protein tyrosine phosphatase [Microbacterium enclense]|nr:protein tyrosine phosphatase [Microbacterium enclense]
MRGETVLRILTVCTGNICRSPLASTVLASRLTDADVQVESAGTRARDGIPMTEEAIDLAAERGVDRSFALAHRARLLTTAHLRDVDMVVAMTREHRRAVVELDPARLRMTFTARELVRILQDVGEPDLAAVAAAGDESPDPPRARFAAMVAALRARRGLVPSPSEPDEDDVIDPFGRSVATYRKSAAQLDPALAAVERLVRHAAPTPREVNA